MPLDIKSHKKKIQEEKPEFNLVPFIDILFTILIFVVVTSSFGATSMDAGDSGNTGKPNMTDSSGNAEYYLMPVNNLQTVTVNGQDMSSLIKDHSIGIHSQVIDQGDIQIKTKDKSIIITTPAGMDINKAVRAPE